MTPGIGEPVGSIVGSVCMATTFPSANRRSRRPLLCSGTALPSLGTKLSVRSPFGVWPAVLCAKSLRRSGEVALSRHRTLIRGRRPLPSKTSCSFVVDGLASTDERERSCRLSVARTRVVQVGRPR
jgi:hypothetical protein